MINQKLGFNGYFVLGKYERWNLKKNIERTEFQKLQIWGGLERIERIDSIGLRNLFLRRTRSENHFTLHICL